jgi:hypothetical protein
MDSFQVFTVIFWIASRGFFSLELLGFKGSTYSISGGNYILQKEKCHFLSKIPALRF